jgi:pyrroline-5-carboxylate reductase
MTPSILADRARGLAGVQVEVWGRDQIVAAGMGAMAAVAQGSEQEPQLITIRYEAPEVAGPVLGYVGKGVTFDSGGISIKPAQGMQEMKMDMSGAAAVLEGVAAIAKGTGLEPGDLDTAREIFQAVGKVVVVDEELMDAVTGLSGSGPAYVAIVIEALADGGVKMGLDRATAMTLATQTVLGSARLLLESGLHPGALKDMVSSPGGTTIAGVAALEDGGLRTTFMKAVERATIRSRELGRGAA